MADLKRKGVASRKHHVKSRAGCRNCKKRKVKCDEKTPSCGNCIKHNVECEFLTSTRGIPVALRAPPPSLNMVDLELLHNFGTRTHATLSERPVVRDFYRVTAVEYGFRHEYIMRTLLAVSACHLAFHRPEQRDHYQALAMSHHQRATKTAMELMGNPTPAEAESLFLFSGLTIYFALGCPRRDDRFLLVGESGFPDWMFLLQGTRTFIAIAGERLGGVLAPLINNAKDCWEAREGYAGPGGAEVHRRLDELRDLIRRRRTDDDDDDARRLAAYVHALDELHLSFSLFDGGDGDGRRPAVRCDLTDAFVWIHEVAGDLLPLLRDATPEAVAIFAFFSVFLKRAGSQWYVQGWADHLIARCYDLLDEEHRLWIQWPLEEIGWIPRAGPDSRYSGDQGTPSSYSQTPS